MRRGVVIDENVDALQSFEDAVYLLGRPISTDDERQNKDSESTQASERLHDRALRRGLNSLPTAGQSG